MFQICSRSSILFCCEQTHTSNNAAEIYLNTDTAFCIDLHVTLIACSIGEEAVNINIRLRADQ